MAKSGGGGLHLEEAEPDDLLLVEALGEAPGQGDDRGQEGEERDPRPDAEEARIGGPHREADVD